MGDEEDERAAALIVEAREVVAWIATAFSVGVAGVLAFLVWWVVR